MSRYLAREELPKVARDNGLILEENVYTGGLVLRRRGGQGDLCPVLYGPQGLIDWQETARAVHARCFGREVSRA